jgi:hypothetical protein
MRKDRRPGFAELQDDTILKCLAVKDLGFRPPLLHFLADVAQQKIFYRTLIA